MVFGCFSFSNPYKKYFINFGCFCFLNPYHFYFHGYAQVKRPFFIFGFSIMQVQKFSPNWISDFNKGRPVAYSRFFECYESDVKRRIKRKLGVFYGDEDLVIEIFHKMIEKTVELEVQFETLENLENYLWHVTESKCNDHKEKEETPVIHMDNLLEYYQRIEDRAKSLAEIKEVAKVLQDEAIQKLPEQCRVIFIMRYIRDMRNKEIAARLHISEKTVENQINIALNKLRMEVGNDAGTMYIIKLLLPLLWAQLTSL
jgi:RNA polymerase sigma factor (sigma-70 family)